MREQMVMGPLVELPGWLQAAGWGLLSASGLLIGVVGGYYTWLQRTKIARVMTFAAGVLLAVVADSKFGSTFSFFPKRSVPRFDRCANRASGPDYAWVQLPHI